MYPLKVIHNVFLINACLFMVMAILPARAVYATQEFQVTDGDIIKVLISKSDLSRLVIGGEGRLDRVWSRDGYLDLEADVVHGEAFFRARPSAPKIFSFFVKDDFGNTYTLTAVQQNIPSQTIVLNSKNSSKKPLSINQSERSQPLKKQVNRLFKSMFHDESIQGYVKEDKHDFVHLWQETMITLIHLYRGHKYEGEVYEVENVSKKQIEFNESEFFDFGKNLIAVGIEYTTLEPKEKTRVFIVRQSSDDASISDS